MTLKQPKKQFTRMLINNWGGISHKMLYFHEYVNLFSGKSGSGKSTVMDAIQVILYGSVSASFLNKAADDTKNRRSVLSYLRGAQKDGSANRGNQDFCAQIVLEIEDTGTHIVTCIGAAFEVGKNDIELKKYSFFSHSGRMPEDEYLQNGIPYSIAQLRKLTEERARSADNRGRGEVNRIYPSKEAYLSTLYDVIFGYIEPGRLMTMEKSAIALRMTNGTGQFIRDYMFPKSKENTVATISEQLGAYREIKERVEDLENRIRILDEIQTNNRRLLNIRADKVRTEMLLRYIDIESSRIRLESRKQDLEAVQEAVTRAEDIQKSLTTETEAKQNELVEVKAAIKASDYGQKQRELDELNKTIQLLADNSARWRQITAGLNQWEEDEIVTDYVSNRALQLIAEIRSGNVTEASCTELNHLLRAALESIEDELQELRSEIKEGQDEVKEKKSIVEDLQNDRKSYPKDLKAARSCLQERLSSLYGRTIHVHIFADLFDVTDEKWKNAVEGRLGRIKKSLITEPAYALDAAKLFRKMKQFGEIDLINSAAIQRDSPQADPNSLYEAVHTESGYVNWCLKRYLGRIRKCETVEELDRVRDGVTPDCYSYSNYMFRHLREQDYTKNACIGTKVSKAKLSQLQEEIVQLEKQLIGKQQMQISLKHAQSFERLEQEPTQLISLSQAADELKDYFKKQEKLQLELLELKNGTLTAELEEKRDTLEAEIRTLSGQLKQIQQELIRRAGDKAGVEKDISNIRERLAGLREGFVPNDALCSEAAEALKKQSEAAYRRTKTNELQSLEQQEVEASDRLTSKRFQFNKEYPAYGFSGVEHENDVYDRVLEQCRRDFEPKYKEEFQKQYELVYHSLRDNVIATIHGEIKAAYHHKRVINRMLKKIRFSDSIYQIDILPAQNENGQFYDMLMAEELDSKVIDNHGFDGQMSLGDDEFFLKYEQKIQLLTAKFMPPREEDGTGRERHKQEMERFADYRNYLTFSMYEQVTDENGYEKKNYVDEMAGVDSGGEGQNPKYVALLAGFAMLYMQQSNRDSKIRLVLLDEAFSKMDKERSEVCLRYARELELQLIVCVPDERLQSLIRNVDSVYGFRRFKNQISMMHIDKGNYLDMIEGRNPEDREDGAETEGNRRNE